MKRKITSILSLLIILSAFTGCSAGKMPQYAEDFITRLGDEVFLPPEVIAEFPEFNSDGKPYLIWSKLNENSNVIHKIEAVFDDDKLTYYNYKSYFFDVPLPDEKLTLNEGESEAMRFINEFRPDLAELEWVNKEWYPSMYDAGNVEAWVADETGVHGLFIMVDLNTGLVVRFDGRRD